MRHALLQSRAAAHYYIQVGERDIRKWGRLFIAKWNNRYRNVGKVFQSGAALLQSGAGVLQKATCIKR